MSWLHKGQEIENPPVGAFGFIYIIIYIDDTAYIGKKNLYTNTKLPIRKSGIPRENSTRISANKNGKRVYFDIVKKDSNWRTYTGSIDIDLPIKHKVILEFLPTKRSLTYREVWWQFKFDVLEYDQYHNQNIGGLYFKNNLL
jgi:hypothetical protein